MAKKSIEMRCNNCGRRIQPHQAGLTIKVRRGVDYFHESWEGCYESTRESGMHASTWLDKELVKITPIY
jgi:hypothetical protein